MVPFDRKIGPNKPRLVGRGGEGGASSGGTRRRGGGGEEVSDEGDDEKEREGERYDEARWEEGFDVT